MLIGNPPICYRPRGQWIPRHGASSRTLIAKWASRLNGEEAKDGLKAAQLDSVQSPKPTEALMSVANGKTCAPVVGREKDKLMVCTGLCGWPSGN